MNIKDILQYGKLYSFITHDNFEKVHIVEKELLDKSDKLDKLDKPEYINDFLNKNKTNFTYFKIVDNNKYNNYTHNNLNVTYEEFQWIPYLYLNTDLVNCGINNKEKAWNHWQLFGKNEERAFSYINNSNNHRGRLGNIFFVNMFLHFISTKFNIKCNYKYKSLFKKLGIFFNKGKLIYDTNILVTEENYINILLHNKEACNIIINNNVWFQSRKFVIMLHRYFKKENIKRNIIKHNKFKERINNNNDLFIHVRLGDVLNRVKNIEIYYEKTISSIKFNKGYISSDSIDNDICKRMIKKYNLIVIDYDEIDTIMFASTCKNIILSGGTFSWLIGFLGFYSKHIYYPSIKDTWYGDIFCLKKWQNIEFTE
jgi:hypothetical protein